MRVGIRIASVELILFWQGIAGVTVNIASVDVVLVVKGERRRRMGHRDDDSVKIHSE